MLTEGKSLRTGVIRIVRTGVLVVVAVVAAGCGVGTLHLTGDDEAIGATVEIDGKAVGQLGAFSYTGSTSPDPVVIERERGLQRESGIHPGQKFAAAEIRVANGPHDLSVMSKTGKRLSRRFTMQGEDYIRVRFRDMRIE